MTHGVSRCYTPPEEFGGVHNQDSLDDGKYEEVRDEKEKAGMRTSGSSVNHTKTTDAGVAEQSR